MVKKIKAVVRGNTVYEISRGKPRKIIHGVSNYFKMRQDEKESNMSQDELDFLAEMEEAEREEEEERKTRSLSPSERRKQILKTVMGNKKRLVSKADGLNKEIAIDDTEFEPEEKIHYNKYRKNKIRSKSKSKRKKGCGCK